MPDESQTIVHGTAVAVETGVVAGNGVGGHLGGVLLRGPSGAGKSDLALRLIDGGARLVADDRTVLSRDGDTLLLGAPSAIAGRLEVRGLGIVPMEAVCDVPLVLLVELVARETVERMPQPATAELLGIAVPLVALDPFEISAVAKVRLAVRAAACGILHRLD